MAIPPLLAWINHGRSRRGPIRDRDVDIRHAVTIRLAGTTVGYQSAVGRSGTSGRMGAESALSAAVPQRRVCCSRTACGPLPGYYLVTVGTTSPMRRCVLVVQRITISSFRLCCAAPAGPRFVRLAPSTAWRTTLKIGRRSYNSSRAGSIHDDESLVDGAPGGCRGSSAATRLGGSAPSLLGYPWLVARAPWPVASSGFPVVELGQRIACRRRVSPQFPAPPPGCVTTAARVPHFTPSSWRGCGDPPGVTSGFGRRPMGPDDHHGIRG